MNICFIHMVCQMERHAELEEHQEVERLTPPAFTTFYFRSFSALLLEVSVMWHSELLFS